MTQLTFDDICENRHGGADTSKIANAKVKKVTDRKMITFLLKGDQQGMTLFDLCEAMDRLPNQISGRLTELRTMGLIRVEGKRKNGQGRVGRVYVGN